MELSSLMQFLNLGMHAQATSPVPPGSPVSPMNPSSITSGPPGAIISLGCAPYRNLSSTAPQLTVPDTASRKTSGVIILASTMTTPPPNFSTQAATNTLWTANTLITTKAPGSSSTTVVPVIVGCQYCGGDGGGIILWNLPKLPSVSFQFPQFPKLPRFHIPCIINCPQGRSSSPATEGEQDPDPKSLPPDPNNSNHPDPTKPEPSQPDTAKSPSSASLSTVPSSTASPSKTTSSSTSESSDQACSMLPTSGFPFGFGPDGLTPLVSSMTGPTPPYGSQSASLLPLSVFGLSSDDSASAMDSSPPSKVASPFGTTVSSTSITSTSVFESSSQSPPDSKPLVPLGPSSSSSIAQQDFSQLNAPSITRT